MVDSVPFGCRITLRAETFEGNRLLERFEALHLLSMNEKGINTFCFVVFHIQQADIVG